MTALNELLAQADKNPERATALWQSMTSPLREFVHVLREQTHWGQPAAVVVGHALIDMATQHRRLCAMDLATGLDTPQKAAMDALEARLEALAQDIPGVASTLIMGDPRGTTMGLHFASGVRNSLTGAYKIPTDDAQYLRLERVDSHFWENIPTESSASLPRP